MFHVAVLQNFKEEAVICCGFQLAKKNFSSGQTVVCFAFLVSLITVTNGWKLPHSKLHINFPRTSQACSWLWISVKNACGYVHCRSVYSLLCNINSFKYFSVGQTMNSKLRTERNTQKRQQNISNKKQFSLKAWNVCPVVIILRVSQSNMNLVQLRWSRLALSLYLMFILNTINLKILKLLDPFHIN